MRREGPAVVRESYPRRTTNWEAQSDRGRKIRTLALTQDSSVGEQHRLLGVDREVTQVKPVADPE